MKRGHVPIRTCVGCRRRRPKLEMIRLAAIGDGLGVSAQGGRGLYLCRDASCVEKGLMRADVKKRLGGSDHCKSGEVPETVAAEENCLDGSHLGRVICDQCHGGRSFG